MPEFLVLSQLVSSYPSGISDLPNAIGSIVFLSKLYFHSHQVG